MSKATSNYKDLIITPKVLAAVLVQSPSNEWYRFDLWQDRIFIMNRREEYENWEDFDSGYNDEDVQELHSIYVSLFGCAAAKNAHKKTLTKAIWAKRYSMSHDRTGVYRTGAVVDKLTGQRERKRNLDRRGYKATTSNNSVHMQEQAMVVHRALCEYHNASGKEYISEGDVKDLMTALKDKGTLKTKQDPFRIFQYYRPAMIKAGLLEFIA